MRLRPPTGAGWSGFTIVPSGAPTGTVLSYFDAALGRPPSEFQGSYVWSGVQQLLASGHASG